MTERNEKPSAEGNIRPGGENEGYWLGLLSRRVERLKAECDADAPATVKALECRLVAEAADGLAAALTERHGG